jgi:hypothetical protein
VGEEGKGRGESVKERRKKKEKREGNKSEKNIWFIDGSLKNKKKMLRAPSGAAGRQ